MSRHQKVRKDIPCEEIVMNDNCVDREVKESDIHCLLWCDEKNGELYESVLECMWDYWENPTSFTSQPFRLWTTYEKLIHIDSDSIIQQACSDLNEDAVKTCDRNSLQKLLDEWCEEQIGTISICKNDKEYVRIDWNI